MSNFWIINYYVRNLYNESCSNRSNTPLQYYETMLVGATDKLCLPATPEEVGQLLAKHHGKFACALPIGFIHALTSAK